MAALANYLEENLLDHLFDLPTGSGDYAHPTVLAVALHTGDPGETGASNEVSGGSYARVDAGSGTTNWTRTNSEVANDNQITFATPSADWGTVSHCSLWDTVSGGNCLFKGAVSTSRTVNNGDPAPYFSAGELKFQLD